jgi:two-component system, sporulation sensor kinase E
MIKSNFLSSIQKKIDKFDIRTLKDFLYKIIDEFDSLKTVFNSMSEGVLVIDIDENIIFYNKMAIRLLEINTNNPKGLHFAKVIKNEKFNNIISSAVENDETIVDYEIKIDSPYNKYISISLQSLVNNGKIIGSIIILNDITINKENEKKLRQAESLAALTTISAGIAHEIKNPLGAIGIHVQLIEQEINNCKCNWSPDFKYSIRVIREEIERLSDIVNNFLFTVRPLKAELLPVNLKEFLDNVTDFILPELEANGISLKKNYSELPEVWLDEKYFKQALLNLIQNSISAIKENGIIEIESYQQQNYVFINIIDNGEGIPEEIQTKIFDPYFTTKNTGTGLGLTILYKIIKEHNGAISFSSKKGETIFTISLPVKKIEKGLIEYTEKF